MFCFDIGGCKSPILPCLFLSGLFNNIAWLLNSILIWRRCLNLKIERTNFPGVSKWGRPGGSCDMALPEGKMEVASSKFCRLRDLLRPGRELRANCNGWRIPTMCPGSVGTKLLNNFKLNGNWDGNWAVAPLDSELSKMWKYTTPSERPASRETPGLPPASGVWAYTWRWPSPLSPGWQWNPGIQNVNPCIFANSPFCVAPCSWIIEWRPANRTPPGALLHQKGWH